jgi:FkbM family methyltransferase
MYLDLLQINYMSSYKFGRLTFFQTLRLKLLEQLCIFFYDFKPLSFAQTGEDQIIKYLLKLYFGNPRNGFYVDLGCNHPVICSSTFSLYVKGWRGIVIDANPDLIQLFKRTRSHDIAVQAAVSDRQKEVVYKQFEMHQLNTIDDVFFEDREHEYARAGQQIMQTRTLQDILNEKLPEGQEIDLLCVDVEGEDFRAIRTLDFRKYRPKLICIEIYPWALNQIHLHPVHLFLSKKEYTLVNFATYNAYFIDNHYLKK